MFETKGEEILGEEDPKQSRTVGAQTGKDFWVQGNPSIDLIRLHIEGVGSVYCFDPSVAPPNGQQYDAVSAYTHPGVSATLWYGFPANVGGNRVAPSSMPAGVSIELKDGVLINNGTSMSSNQQFRFTTSDLTFCDAINVSFQSDILKRVTLIYKATGV